MATQVETRSPRERAARARRKPVQSAGRTDRSSTKPASARDASARLPRAFFDTNILLYAEDARFPKKQMRAASLILEHRQQSTAVLSLQVLQEYFSNATRKLGLDAADARRRVEIYSRFHLVEPTIDDVLGAIDLHRLHHFNYWDALVIQCARKSGCRMIFTEDLPHGQVIDGVQTVNPFL